MRALGGRKKKLFFESDSEAGWLRPRRPRGRGRWKVWPRLAARHGPEGQAGAPAGAPGPSAAPAPAPRFLSRRRSPGPGGPVAPRSPGTWPFPCDLAGQRPRKGCVVFPSLCVQMSRPREGQGSLCGHTAQRGPTATAHCHWPWGPTEFLCPQVQERVSPGNALKPRATWVLVPLPHYRGSPSSVWPKASLVWLQPWPSSGWLGGNP